jgi:hypothetical protein
VELRLTLHENFYKGNPDGKSVAIATIRKGVPIKSVSTDLGPVKTIFLITEIIRRYCSQFNVNKNMTPDQIEDLAGELYLMFVDRLGNSVMLEELITVFDRAARGDFLNQQGKKIIPFDRIDRTLIEEFLDVYFETDRTQAIWQLEDDKRNAMENQLNEKYGGAPVQHPRETPLIVLDKQGNDVTPKNIYDLAGTGAKFTMAKTLKQLHEKYGNDTASAGSAGNDPGNL